MNIKTMKVVPYSVVVGGINISKAYTKWLVLVEGEHEFTMGERWCVAVTRDEHADDGGCLLVGEVTTVRSHSDLEKNVVIA